MNKEPVKKVMYIIFSVAMFLGLISLVGFVFLHFRFEKSYFKSQYPWLNGISLNVFGENDIQAFRVTLIVSTTFLVLAGVLTILLFVLNISNIKNKKLVHLFNILLPIFEILCCLGVLVTVALLSNKLPVDGYWATYISNYYDMMLKSALSATLPLIFAGAISLWKFASDYDEFRDKHKVSGRKLPTA